jgi:hypothetical protein
MAMWGRMASCGRLAIGPGPLPSSGWIGNILPQQTRRQRVRLAQNSGQQISRRDLPPPRDVRDLARGFQHAFSRPTQPEVLCDCNAAPNSSVVRPDGSHHRFPRRVGDKRRFLSQDTEKQMFQRDLAARKGSSFVRREKDASPRRLPVRTEARLQRDAFPMARRRLA